MPNDPSSDCEDLMLPDPERVCLERIRAGDARAFEELFRAYQLELRRFVYRYVDSWAIAEDLVHDVFVAIWRRRTSWTVRGSLRLYLFTAARNNALSHLRREIRERRWRASLERGPLGDSGRHAENDGLRNLEQEERTALVRAAIAELPDRCREAIILRWQRQLSYAEIADAMQISVKTVEIHLTRGAKMLRARFRQVFPAE